MAKDPNSIDGFIPRRSRGDIEHAQNLARPNRTGRMQPLTNNLANHDSARIVGQPQRRISPLRSEIDESLRSIDQPQPEKKQSRRDRRRQTDTHPRRRALIKRLVITLIVVIAAIGLFLGIRAWMASNNIFQGNIFDVLQSQALKQDDNGRSNILIFGTAEDDEGGEHGGANLTDSIMVLSIDQTKKDAYMLSIPRDLWVSYEETCTVGNEGKVNAVYFCASDDGQDEPAGAMALQRKIGEVTGLDIQYYAHINFTAVVEAVDAVGGVDVTIESDDPRGILDRNFDWKCGYQCYYVNYKNGETVHLDGEHALALARARNASGGYGLSGGNFSREQNQQKILVALKDKALSVGTLTNLGKVSGLIDAMGSNLRTNFEMKEIRTLMGLGETITSDKINSLTLADEEEPLVTTGSYAGQSIVHPVAGLRDFSDIHAYVRRSVAATPITREDAAIAVLNASGISGLAQSNANQIEEAGFTIAEVGNAPDGTYNRVELYQIAADKPATAEALAKYLGVSAKKTVPFAVAEGVDFVVVYGPDSSTP